MTEQQITSVFTSTEITEDQAKEGIQSLNLINGFLFDSVIENKEDAKVVIGYILSTIYNKKVKVEDVTSQKVFQAIDTQYHSIRLDAFVHPSNDSSSLTASVYDVEIAGDMYYKAKTILTTHPQIDYEDGITHIFLYCKGNPNLKEATHSKKVAEMLQYILSGEKPSTPNADIDDIDNIVSKVKALPEVTNKYMKQWDREQTLQREAYDNGEKNGETKGIKNTTVLFSWLKSNGRQDDVLKAIDDSDFLSKLFTEYEEWKKSIANNQQS